MQPSARSNARRQLSWLLAATAVLLSVFGLLGTAPAAAAAQGDQLLISPQLSEADIAPGAAVTRTVSLTNASDGPRSITAAAKNFQPAGELGQAALCTTDCPYALADWMRIDRPAVTVAAKGRHDFRVTVDVPREAGPGSYFGAVVLSAVVASTGKSGIQVVPAVTSLFLIKVSGAANEQARVESLSATHATGGTAGEARIFARGPVRLALRVRNEGNVVVRPTGTIEVRDVFGRRVAELPVPEERVLPASTRLVTLDWQPGRGFGPYTAELRGTYGESRQALTASTHYWVVPLLPAVTLGVVLALFAALLLRWILRRRQARRTAAATSASMLTPTG